jgi:hypothetical protein
VNRRYLRCSDGSRVNVDHVNRFFIQADITHHEAKIMASVSGPQMPFTIFKCDSEEDAQNVLDELVTKLETE